MLYPHRKKIDWLSGVNVAAMLRCFVSPRDITYKLKLMSDLMDHPRSHYQLGHICSIWKIFPDYFNRVWKFHIYCRPSLNQWLIRSKSIVIFSIKHYKEDYGTWVYLKQLSHLIWFYTWIAKMGSLLHV